MWTCNGDMNWALGEISKELSSSTVSAETSFDDDSNKSLNVNNILPAIIEKNGYKFYSNITCPSPTVQSLLRNVLDVNHHTL